MLRDHSSKDSWKTRQDAVQSIITLTERKKYILNTPAVGTLLTELKDHLTETNLNLRAKVIISIEHVIKAIGIGAQEYASLLLPSIVRLTSETKSNVVDAVFTFLNAWIQFDQVPAKDMFVALGPYLPDSLKAPKGRLRMLEWILKNSSLLDRSVVEQIASVVMDCMTDKDAKVRAHALKLVETMATMISRNVFEQYLTGRPSPDIASLRRSLDMVYGQSAPSSALYSTHSAESPQPPRPSSSLPSHSTSLQGGRESGSSVDDFEQRRQALANRPNARVLGKPKAGEGFKARLSAVKSSIPRPGPRVSAVSVAAKSQQSVLPNRTSVSLGSKRM